MSSAMEVNYHTTGPTLGERGTSVTTTAQTTCVVISIGPGAQLPELRIYVNRAAEAFALAQAFAAAGEVLEKRAAATRVGEVPSEPWTEVELPLEPTEVCGWRSPECAQLGCRSEDCPAF